MRNGFSKKPNNLRFNQLFSDTVIVRCCLLRSWVCVLFTMANDDNSWRTAEFRQNIVNKIDEAIQQAGMPNSRNSRVMETHVFEKSKTREEYLTFVARIILHVREVNMKKGGMVNGVGLGVGGMGMMQGMPDPINALQTLARQGTGLGQGGGGGPGGPQQANATTLLQTLNQRPNMQRLGMGPNVQGQPIPGQMQASLGNQLGQMAAQMNQMGGQINQMGGPMGGQMGNQMQRQMGGQIQGPMGPMSGPMGTQMSGQMGQMGGQMPMANQMGSQMQGQMSGQMAGPMGGQMGGQMVGQMNGQMGNQMGNQMSMNGQIPSQMQGQLPVQMNGQMPAQIGGQMGNQIGGQMGGQMGPNQMNGQIPGQMMNQINNHIGGPMSAQMNGQMGNQMANQLPSNINSSGPNQMMGQMGSQIANQMGNQMHGQMSGQLQQSSGPMGGIGLPNQMTGAINPQMGGQMHGQMGQINTSIPSPMQNAMHMPQRKGNENAMMNQNTNFVGPRTVTPNQFLRQSPSPSVQSPASIGAGPPSNQMASSPAVSMAPSPGSQMGSVQGQPRSIGVALSPGSSINTPGQSQPTSSPLAQPLCDEQAYREKIRYLSKYIEPLRRMITTINDGEKMKKMKQLLDILCNPQKRTQMETLQKCEHVLEKLNVLKYAEQQPSPSSNIPPASMGSLKDNSLLRPLLEALNTTLQSPMANHTLQRTFGATNQALFGSDLKLMPPPKKKKIEESPSDIPELLQGEIARLDQRFKVSLDQTQQCGANSIQLLCWLDDRHLPCVPPVSLTVPDDYPSSPPRCVLGLHDYGATEFLMAVQSALDARMKKLPIRFSVSQLLHTWEMAVRQASAPSSSQPSATTVLLGL